ncbi:MAG: DUF692 domain-containing protein [Pseudomonadota bacterium]
MTQAGIGLRHAHVVQVLNERPAVGFLEVHSENYMSEGGPRRRALFELRHDYAVSLHGVGLSLGSAEGLDSAHLDRLAGLVQDYEPFLVSEHLSWSVAEAHYLNDLLPLPYTEEALTLVVANVQRCQERLGRQILVENPSSYVTFAESTLSEPAFLAEVAARSGCGLLLDVNNIYVTAQNHGLDAKAYIEALPGDAVGEIHLAGHRREELEGGVLLIDAHDRQVCEGVWDLYRFAIARLGRRPTLVEWDNSLPPLEILLGEAAEADRQAAAALETAGGLRGAA